MIRQLTGSWIWLSVEKVKPASASSHIWVMYFLDMFLEKCSEESLKMKKETFIKKAGSYVGLLRRYGLYAALYYIRALRDSLIIWSNNTESRGLQRYSEVSAVSYLCLQLHFVSCQWWKNGNSDIINCVITQNRFQRCMPYISEFTGHLPVLLLFTNLG